MAWLRTYDGRYYWVNDGYTGTTSSTTSTIVYLTQSVSSTTSTWSSNTIYYPVAQHSSSVRWVHRNAEAEQRALFERERARQAAMFEGHAEAASALADGLLMEHLTPEQRECFKQNKWFVVEGGKSKQKYRICAKDNLIANVDVLEGDSIRHRLCAHADPKVMPLGDHLLAQKMMIEFAEDNFLRVANRHAYHGRA